METYHIDPSCHFIDPSLESSSQVASRENAASKNRTLVTNAQNFEFLPDSGVVQSPFLEECLEEETVIPSGDHWISLLVLANILRSQLCL